MCFCLARYLFCILFCIGISSVIVYAVYAIVAHGQTGMQQMESILKGNVGRDIKSIQDGDIAFDFYSCLDFDLFIFVPLLIFLILLGYTTMWLKYYRHRPSSRKRKISC